MKNLILGIPIQSFRKSEVLDKIIRYIERPTDFFHLVSLNPENLVVADENRQFKKVLGTAQAKIIDGAGIVLAGQILGVDVGERVTGVEMMDDLLNVANSQSLKVMLIGGRPKIADKVVECQKEKFPKIKFFAFQGIKNIKELKPEEEEKVFSIVADFKPHFLFVAFGSPNQELWLYKNRKKLKNIVCMGVGGGFDYLAGVIPRAPKILRRLGLEWIFRLVVQPWRWKRQSRLIKFVWLVIKERLRGGQI